MARFGDANPGEGMYYYHGPIDGKQRQIAAKPAPLTEARQGNSYSSYVKLGGKLNEEDHKAVMAYEPKTDDLRYASMFLENMFDDGYSPNDVKYLAKFFGGMAKAFPKSAHFQLDIGYLRTEIEALQA